MMRITVTIRREGGASVAAHLLRTDPPLRNRVIHRMGASPPWARTAGVLPSLDSMASVLAAKRRRVIDGGARGALAWSKAAASQDCSTVQAGVDARPQRTTSCGLADASRCRTHRDGLSEEASVVSSMWVATRSQHGDPARKSAASTRQRMH